jgi:polysaccharide biosynthesis protein PslH
MGYRPNVDAAEHYIRDILPLVRQQVPDAVFTAVGQLVPRSLAALAGPGINITGWVPDVRPYLAAAAVAVVPVRIGGGTRLKVLEALAMGKAVVSTRLGCEGIDVTDGQHLLVADDPEDFARRVVSLMRDPGRARALGDEGRRLIERQYDWKSVARALEAFHQRVLQEGGYQLAT